MKMGFKMEFNKFTLFIIVLLIAVSLGQAIFFTKGNLVLNGDQGLLLTDTPSIYAVYNSLFIWSNTAYGGNIVGIPPLPSLLFETMGGLLFFVFSFDIGGILVATIFLSIASLGMFFLLKYITNQIDSSKLSIISSILGAILIVLISENYSTYLSLSFIPFTTLFVLKLGEYINSGQKREARTVLFSTIFCMSFMIDLSSIDYLFAELVFLAVLILSLFLLSSKKKNFIKYFSIVILLSFLINLNLLISTPILENTAYSSFFSKATYTSLVVANAHSIIYSIIGYVIPFMAPIANFAMLIGMLILVVILFGMILTIGKKHSKFLLPFLTIYVIFIAFVNLTSKPFGAIFNYFLNRFNFLLAIRTPFLAFSPFFLFVGVTLFSISIFEIGNFIINSKRVNKSEKFHFFTYFAYFVFIIAVAFSFIYVFDYLPLHNYPYNTPALSHDSLPAHVTKIVDYIIAQKSNFNVGIVPIAVAWQVSNWYIAANIYSQLIYNKGIFTGGFSNQIAEADFPQTNNLYTSGVGYSNFIDAKNISKLFGIFGIKYIILQGDAIDYMPCNNCTILPLQRFNLTKIRIKLNNSSLKEVSSYSNSSIYENTNYVPLVYASDIQKLNNSSEAIFSIIESKTFNVQNTSVYSTNMGDFYNDSTTINATSIANFSKPDISFVEDNPTKVTIHVFNATTPYYLVFRETYDPHWAAFYSNGTEVNSRDHIAVNGFANAWYMNKAGNYTVTLYYTLQTYADITWVVSFATLFATIGIGIYGWKAPKRSPRRRNR